MRSVSSTTAFTFRTLIHSSTTLIHFVDYIHGRTALIFRTLCPWLYEAFTKEGCRYLTHASLRNEMTDTRFYSELYGSVFVRGYYCWKHAELRNYKQRNLLYYSVKKKSIIRIYKQRNLLHCYVKKSITEKNPLLFTLHSYLDFNKHGYIFFT